MADNIVEFINSTQTYSDLVTGVTIAETGASEQANVKNVVASISKERSFSLKVGDTPIASFTGSSRLEGNELLGASNSLKLTTDTVALFNKIYVFDGTSQFATNSVPTKFSGETISGNYVASSFNTSYTPPSSLSTNPYFVVIAENGDFYYSNNAGSSLYRRAGGPNGTQTIVTSYGQAPSYDGRYIYSFNSTNMAVTDTQNNGSVVQGSCPGLTESVNDNYGASAAIDGYVWVKPNYNTGSFLINGSTRQAVDAGGAGGNANRYHVGIGRNSAGDYIGVQATDSNPSLVYWNFGRSLANIQISESSVNISMYSYTADSNHIVRPLNQKRYLFNFPGVNYNTVIDLDNISDTSVATTFSFTEGSFDFQSARFIAVDLSKASEEFGELNIRATGIKVTT